MKRIILIYFLIINFSLYAQNSLKKIYNNEIKLDIFLPIVALFDNADCFGFSFEKMLNKNKKNSIEVLVEYYFLNKNNYRNFNTIQIIPQFKFFNVRLFKKKYYGIYSKFIRYNDIFFSSLNKNEIILDYIDYNISIGGFVGDKIYIFKNRFVIDFTLGAGAVKNIYWKPKVNNVYAVRNKKISFDGLLSLKLGYCFGKNKQYPKEIH